MWVAVKPSGHRHRPVGVVAVEDVFVLDFRVGRVHIGPVLRSAASGGWRSRWGGFQPQRQQRDRRVVGNPDRPQRVVIAPRARARSVRSGCVAGGPARPVHGGRAVLRRDRCEQRDQRHGAPRAIHQRRCGSSARQRDPAEHRRRRQRRTGCRRQERVAGVDRQPDARQAANTATATTPAIAPGARARAATPATAPHRARADQHRGAGSRRCAAECTRGTLAIPVSRPDVSAVWRVLVSDHRGFPVTSSRSHPTSGGGGRGEESQRARAVVRSEGSRAAQAGVRQRSRYSQYSPEKTHASGRSSPASASRASTGAPARGGGSRQAARTAPAAGRERPCRRARHRRAPVRASAGSAPRATRRDG